MSREPASVWRRKPHHYWWILANTLMACIAVVVWVMCLHVFGHPEVPRNYQWLSRLGLASPPYGVPLQQAPPGEATAPEFLYRRYAGLDDEETRRLNAALMRNYLQQLEEPDLIQYVEGEFEVTAVRDLTGEDLFDPGFGVRARAMVQPDEFSKAAPYPLTIDYLFPTPEADASRWFLPGDRLQVAKVPNCALLLHLAHDREADTTGVHLTVVPIAMGTYRVGDEHSFRIATPDSLRPGASLPALGPPQTSIEPDA